MKLVVTATVAALLVGGMSLGPVGPAFAQSTAPATSTDAQPSSPSGASHWHMHRQNRAGGPGGMIHPGWHKPAGGAGLLALACGDRGAEALEIALVHMYYRVKPTETQQPLYDTLKSAALADQKTFAAACKASMHHAGGQPDILDRLQSRLALDQARVAALSDVVPKFKAFYDSLTADQKSRLESVRHRPGNRGIQQGWQQHRHHAPHPGPGDHGKPATPTSPSADPASSST